jgi:hypothetical protein
MRFIYALVFVLFVDVMFFFGQMTIDKTMPGTSFYDTDDAVIMKYDSGNFTREEFTTDQLPNSQKGVSTIGETLTDTFSTVKQWFLDVTGLRYLDAFINAVPRYIDGMGAPVEAAFALGTVWHAMSVILLIWGLKE